MKQGRTSGAVRLPRKLRSLATSLVGETLRDGPPDLALTDLSFLERHRVAAAIARRVGGANGIALPPTPLQTRYYRAAARVAMLIETRQRIAGALGARGIPWAPIKGGDLAFRAYDVPEDRDFGDLDVLVAEDQRGAATAALEGDGWLAAFEAEGAVEDYLREEGYCTSFSHRSGVLLELHYRLWGSAPAGFGAEVLEASTPDLELAPTGRRITDAHAFVVAAFHAWTVKRPRPISNWWDLQRLAMTSEAGLAEEVVAVARRWELQLPVGLAALSAASLWPEEPLLAIAHALLPGLRTSERLLTAWCVRRGVDAVPFWGVVMARLAARRPSRHGWRSAWRRIWPHPAVRSRGRGL